jgi:hypothetical protein
VSQAQYIERPVGAASAIEACSNKADSLRRANELRNPTADQCICLSTVLTILKLEGVEAGHLGQALMTFFKVAGNCAMRKRTL